MKKIVFLIIFGSICGISGVRASESDKQFFTITGYYSPLPGQQFYVTGSYESEIRLNGRGVAGADGTPVYPGMIAAPADFPFGTKICVPGFGCGTVRDRGGAIVRRGERDLARHDRLDLWMGYGDEGLLRALSWGVKQVECEVFAPDSKIAESVNFSAPMPIFQVLDLPPRPIFPENLRFGDRGILVRDAQAALKTLGFFAGEVDGIFSKNFENSVLEFQQKNFIVQSRDSAGAGIFGPQTRKTISEEFHRFLAQKKIREMWTEFHFEKNLRRGERNRAVLKLQTILAREEFLEVAPTGYFGPKTESALAKFQVARGILNSISDFGAGLVGDATREELNRILIENREKKSAEKSQILSYEKSRTKFRMLVAENFKISGRWHFGNSGDEVRKLQLALKKLGYFSGEASGYFGWKTETAVRKFQLDHGVISGKRGQGAGIFGNATKKALFSAMTKL